MLTISPNLAHYNITIIRSKSSNGTRSLLTNIVQASPRSRLTVHLHRICSTIRRRLVRVGISILIIRQIFDRGGMQATVNATRTTTIYVLTTARLGLPIRRRAPARIGTTIAKSNHTSGTRITFVIKHVLNLHRLPGPISTASTLTLNVYRI